VDLPEDWLWDLVLGPSEDRPAFASDEARREGWLAKRGEIMAGSFGTQPGRRPQAWWQYTYDGPEPPAWVESEEEALYLLHARGPEKAKIRATWDLWLAKAKNHPDVLEFLEWACVPTWYAEGKPPPKIPARRRKGKE
jgi:hypothetical protein